MKKILILNGSPHTKGNTAGLIEQLKAGAEESGHEVTVVNLRRLDIKPCLGCVKGGKNPDAPCVQKDGMLEVYPAYEAADVVVLASPVYYWGLSGLLKMAFDRLFAVAEKNPDFANPRKEVALLVAGEENNDDNIAAIKVYYDTLCKHLNWTDRGLVYAGGVLAPGDIAGHEALGKARLLGKTL